MKDAFLLHTARGVGEGACCGRQRSSAQHLCPVICTHFDAASHAARFEIGAGKARPHRIGFVGYDRSALSQRQQVTADAAAQVEHGSRRRAGVEPAGMVAGHLLCRRLFQRLRRKEETVSVGELGGSPPAQARQGQHCAGVGRRQLLAQLCQQRQRSALIQVGVAQGIDGSTALDRQQKIG